MAESKTQQKKANAVEKVDYFEPSEYEGSGEFSKGEIIGLGVLGTLLAGLVGWAIWSDVKTQQEIEENTQKIREDRERKAKETREWRDSERAKGNVTLRLANGDLLSVSAEAYQNASIRPSKDT